MLSESVKPNLTTSTPSFRPTQYFGQPSLNTRPLSNLEPALRRTAFFSAFFSSSFSRDAEEWRVDFTQRRVK
jgi:hypothetical protein